MERKKDEENKKKNNFVGLYSMVIAKWTSSGELDLKQYQINLKIHLMDGSVNE